MPIKSSEELWALHSLQEVTGFVYLDLRRHPTSLKNLTFLENLRKIGGEHFRISLAVLHGDIEFAGLHKLQDSPHGSISFIESPNLCYVQTIDAKGIQGSHFEIQLHNLSTADECRAKGAYCHPSCNPAFGCWGPRREDCIRCRSHSIKDTICVNSCTELPGYYETPIEDISAELSMTSPPNPMTKRLQLARLAAGHIMDEVSQGKSKDAKASISCLRCHSECAQTCTGPGPDQCVGPCKHASFKGECVVECPHNTFLDARKGVCTPCNAKCHQRSLSRKPVCSGPGNYPGPGGCKKCEMFLEFISFDGILKEHSVRTQHGALLCMHGACPMGTFRTIESVDALSRFRPFVEEGVHAVPACRSCHSLCRTCNGYSVLRATNTTPGCLDYFTFQISLTHPPEVHVAYHFRQSLDRRGLFLTSNLPSPIRGSDSFPRPQLWTRHINGKCLLCHKECRGGCWGPTSAHCRRCVHYRVWHSGALDKKNELWHLPNDSTVTYMLNKDAFNPPEYGYSKSDKRQKNPESPMHFTCEVACPAEMPFTKYDPLTGDLTCHTSANVNSDSVLIERQLSESAKESHKIGAGLVVPLAVVLTISLICIALACLFKRRQRRPKNSFITKPSTSPFVRVFDKILRLHSEPNNGRPHRVVSYTAGSRAGTLAAENGGFSGFSDAQGASLYAASNRITWSSSEGSACQFCHDSSADGVKSPQPILIYRNGHSYNPIYRRSVRQQPNMGRLVMINLDDIQLPENKVALGTGAFGAVYKGIWRIPDGVEDVQVPTFEGPDNRRHVNVAVKILNEQNGSSDLQALLEEAKVMCSVRHKNCLQLLGVCLAGSQKYLVSEYIANGSLDGYIRRSRHDLPHRLLLLWAEQIADGMAYLQSAGIIHRDLATRNVLVKERDWVQITDFGLAKMLSGEEEESEEVVVQSGRVPIRWLAIETLTSGRYSFKTDIWAYGVTLWEIFTFGQRPYPTIETKDVKRYVVTGGRLQQPDICTLETYQRLLLACWRENPEERISFADILQLLRSKADTIEYFLHSRPTSSLISTNTRTTRLSGAYSESSARRDRDSGSSPPGELTNTPTSGSSIQSNAARRYSSSHRSTDGLPPRAQMNHSIKAKVMMPQSHRPTQYDLELESLPTTVEYTTTSNDSAPEDYASAIRNAVSDAATSGEVTLALPAPNNENIPTNFGSGGYVWPVPMSDHTVGQNGGGGGEYVGPLFRNFNDNVDD
ncbi:unnamed protein product [Rodentolepis nana]|uniref:Protein kinase domain-containing protein n=1 Tax=Rodentolepis nana TaxID=102285 RepID=A0A3P7RRN1_RODNA|nr:unnamed protein product [Rodentolepis nana]